jgi:hypothetical protein
MLSDAVMCYYKLIVLATLNEHFDDNVGQGGSNYGNSLCFLTGEVTTYLTGGIIN